MILIYKCTYDLVLYVYRTVCDRRSLCGRTEDQKQKKGGVFLGLCFCVVVCPEILLQVLFFCFGSGSLFSLSLSFSFVEYNFCR